MTFIQFSNWDEDTEIQPIIDLTITLAKIPKAVYSNTLISITKQIFFNFLAGDQINQMI